MTGVLRHELADYLALRRAMGYRLARPEKLLGQFLDYLQSHGETRITVATALDWARLPASNGTSNWRAYRLSAVRGFATYLHALDPTHEVPAADLLPQRTHRACPYLYSGADIASLIAATDTLRTELRRATFATLIGLLSVTGDPGWGSASRWTATTSTWTQGSLWCATESSARPDNCLCIPAALTRCATMRSFGTGSPRRPAHRRSSCPWPEPGCSTATFITRSTGWCAWPGSHPARRRAVRAYTISDTPSPSRRCSTPTRPERTARPG